MAFFDPFFNIAREQVDEYGVNFLVIISFGPFKNKRVRVIVDEVVLTAAELTNIELIISGRVESKYGKRGVRPASRHRIGGKYTIFTIRRWYKFGDGQSVFFNLHKNNTTFEIEQYVTTAAGDLDLKGLRLTVCKSYNYRLVTGTPNDIIAEELSGYATGWASVLDVPIFPVPVLEEQIVNGGFETGDLTGWIGDLDVINIAAHLGNFGARCYPITGVLEQTLAEQILVSSVDELSFYAKSITQSGIVNGGFETGDLTGWISSGSISNDPNYVHSGLYGFYGPNRNIKTQNINVFGGNITNFNVWIKHIVLGPVPEGTVRLWICYVGEGETLVANLTSLVYNTWINYNLLPYVNPSKTILYFVFQYYYNGFAMDDVVLEYSNGGTNTIEMIITHSDLTTTSQEFTVPTDNNWNKYTFTNFLPLNKTITKITINLDVLNETYIDDVSLMAYVYP